MYSNSLQSQSIQTPKSAVTNTSLLFTNASCFRSTKKSGAWFFLGFFFFFFYRWINLSVWRWWKRCGMRILLQSRPVAPPITQPALIPQWPQNSYIPRICSNIQWETQQWFHPPPLHHNGNRTHSFPSNAKTRIQEDHRDAAWLQKLQTGYKVRDNVGYVV